MSTNDYHFITHWRVKSTLEEVYNILSDTLEFPRWCPSVYLSVTEVHSGGADHIGRVMQMHTKGRLPYTIRWFSRLAESNRPYGFTIEASGDFQGRGVWTFSKDGRHVKITYDWRVRAGKPLLKYLSFLLKPIFAANHRWAMARGEEGLRAELARRAGAGQQPAAHRS
jgi:hypothetical protein